MTMRHRFPPLPVLAIGGLLLAPAGTDAQTKDVRLHIRYSPDFTRCMDRAGGSTMPMLDCLRGETARWDQRLNTAYRAIMNNRDVSDATRNSLREAQRAWITYRDAACTTAGNLEAEGGSLALIVTGDCVLRMTAQRAAELDGGLAVE